MPVKAPRGAWDVVLESLALPHPRVPDAKQTSPNLR